MNPYTQVRNYKPLNIRYYLQGKWRAFIIRQYNKLNLPESSIFQKIIKYEKYLGTCPHCGCPMSEILLTDKECESDKYITGTDSYTDNKSSPGIVWVTSNTPYVHENRESVTSINLEEFVENLKKAAQNYDKRKF